MLCPHCRHSDGLHSAPSETGRAADGALLAEDYQAGKCHHTHAADDGALVFCDCPGWYPNTTPMQLVAATMAARAERTAEIAELPFGLTPPRARSPQGQQGELF